MRTLDNRARPQAEVEDNGAQRQGRLRLAGELQAERLIEVSRQ
jgi:hypothetical protein